MKISHTQLEERRVNPRSWVQARAADPFFTFGYNQALLHAIHNYHLSAGDAGVARRYLQELIDSHFKNETRSDAIRRWLEAYIKWHRRSGVIVADSKFRIKLNLGVLLELRGEVHRFDVPSGGYRAVLLGDYARDWDSQLRMPLLQKSTALRFGRPVADVSVGVQHLDGSDMKVKHYSRVEISDAESEFKNLSRKVQSYGDSIPGFRE
jgi:hypothetical protein